MEASSLAVDRAPRLLANGFTAEQIASTITPLVQELILLPTEKCNLRCTYCYEDFAIGRMSETTQRGIELFLDRRVPDLSELRMSWFGGEPLAAKGVVLRLAGYAKALCEQHNVRFTGGLTTNAYLLDRELLDALLDRDQDFFQITLDGWGADHDAVRKFADGRGTFDRIWRNLLGMRGSDRSFDALLRIHVRRENIDVLPVLMENLGREFGGDDRFRLDFEHVRNLGGTGGATVKDGVRRDEMPAIEAEMRAIFRSHGPAPKGTIRPAPLVDLDEALRAAKAMGESAGGQRREDLAVGGNYICYASKANSLMIRANGRIGKCTVAFDDDRNDIGSLRPDGSVSIDNDKLRPWLHGLTTLDVVSMGCPLSTLARATSPAPLRLKA